MTLLKSKPFDKNLTVNVTSIHVQDDGSSDLKKLFGLNKEQVETMEVHTLDIFSMTKNELNIPKFVSKKTGRGPLKKGWIVL